MEEYEKRRERLRAMRVEADQADNSNNLATPEIPGSLSNPLAEAPLQEEPPSNNNNNRFDFYTDPMSVFSANKRRNDNTLNDHISSKPMMAFPSPRPGPRIAEPTPQAHRYQGNYAPADQRMYQPRPFRGPMGIARPYNEYQGNQNYPIRPGPMGISRPYNSYQGNPNHPIRPDFAPNYSNDNSPSIPSPGFGPTASPYHGGQERAQWVNNSPSHGPGRGRGRGRHHGGRSSGPERFYNESMIEDPWKFLEPVIWNEVKATVSSLRVQNPVGPKKVRVSDDSNSKPDSQPSLAEYLAASFNEAVDDDSLNV